MARKQKNPEQEIPEQEIPGQEIPEPEEFRNRKFQGMPINRRRASARCCFCN